MKPLYIFWLLLLPFLTLGNKSYGDNKLPALEGPYLGQKPPGLIPEVFAPGIVSTKHRDLSAFFTPDMQALYFTRKENNSKKWSLITFTLENNRWRKSAVVPRVGRPFISPDGNTLHLGKKYRQRSPAGWSEIKSLGSPYEDIRIMRLTASSAGTYVFDEGTRDGKGVLRYSRVTDGKREQPKPLGKAINTGKWNAHPFIAPDESYLMWDGERDGGFGGNDIYISFRQPDGSWGTAINLGDKVNTDGEQSSPYVTPDGKYLFFNSYNSQGNGDIYWADARMIEALRPKSAS
ncbi:hypothetical protein [Thalassomonas sp. RHCl1]|uniref:TolB family protein n=1 Tax=Thalassomonas sp. RHCl1 TaxID=2995320 RepID=UPI00248C7078|nr:hypothetical protein [Thalassomonas sp. RHCl1]